MIKIVSVLTIVLLCGIFAVTPVRAGDVVFSDSFSDFHKWQPTRDNGSLWRIVNGKADIALTQGHSISELVPKDEYWLSTWTDLEYNLDYTPLAGLDRNISFNVKNNQNWYEIHFVDTFFNLVRVQNGQQPFDVSHPYVMENGQTYRIKIRFEMGHIEVYSNGQLLAQEFDPSFNQQFGKIGIKVTTGVVFPTHVQFDNVEVKRIISERPFFAVPLYKQHDSRWGNLEYDTAKDWSSNPSIARWGCALTSAVMILRYHGITWLPNGQDLNPATLNTWLKQQKDGYVGRGLLNWPAITRLTKLVSDQHGTAKLEYARKGSDFMTYARVAFGRFDPVIFEVPGHFVVASGLTENQDIWITDPAFSRTKLSQHQAPLSLRLLTPSHTDLSYIVITAETSAAVSVTDPAGTPVDGVETYTEIIQSSDGEESLPPQTIIQIPKPDTQRYKLVLDSSQPQPYSIEVFMYDVDGNVILQEETGTVNDQAQVIEIEFHKERVTNWEGLHELIEDFYQQSAFSRYLTFFKFERLIGYATTASLPNQLRYTYLLLELLEKLQTTMPSTTYHQIKSYLLQLQAELI